MMHLKEFIHDNIFFNADNNENNRGLTVSITGQVGKNIPPLQKIPDFADIRLIGQVIFCFLMFYYSSCQTWRYVRILQVSSCFKFCSLMKFLYTVKKKGNARASLY